MLEIKTVKIWIPLSRTLRWVFFYFMESNILYRNKNFSKIVCFISWNCSLQNSHSENVLGCIEEVKGFHLGQQEIAESRGYIEEPCNYGKKILWMIGWSRKKNLDRKIVEIVARKKKKPWQGDYGYSS
jgi:hypothetical protein